MILLRRSSGVLVYLCVILVEYVLELDVLPSDLDAVCPASPVKDKHRTIILKDSQRRHLQWHGSTAELVQEDLIHVLHDIRSDRYKLGDFNRVVMVLGSQDTLMAAITGETFASLVEKFTLVFEAVHKSSPDAFIYWVAVPPSLVQGPAVNHQIRAVNFALARLCADAPQGIFIDTSSSFYNKDGSIIRDCFMDFKGLYSGSTYFDILAGWTYVELTRSIQNVLPLSIITDIKGSRAVKRLQTPVFTHNELAGRFDCWV